MSKKIVTVLKKESVILGIFTNNLAAHDQLRASVPSHEVADLPSYSTVNRTVRSAGESKAFNTSVGTFTIQKMTLFKKAF